MDVDAIEQRLSSIRENKRLHLLGRKGIAFDETKQLVMHKRKVLPGHANAMRFTAVGDAGKKLRECTYYSVGGGFVADEKTIGSAGDREATVNLPYPFTSGEELLQRCRDNVLSISGLTLENEKYWRTEQELRDRLLRI